MQEVLSFNVLAADVRKWRYQTLSSWPRDLPPESGSNEIRTQKIGFQSLSKLPLMPCNSECWGISSLRNQQLWNNPDSSGHSQEPLQISTPHSPNPWLTGTCKPQPVPPQVQDWVPSRGKEGPGRDGHRNPCDGRALDLSLRHPPTLPPTGI